MNELTKKYGAPALPSVNLLPRDIAEKRKLRAVQLLALMMILIAVGVVVVGYVLALGAKQLANGDRDDALASQTAAISERDAKAPVYDAYRSREVQEYTLAQIGIGEMDYNDLSAAVFDAVDDNTSLASVVFVGPNAQGFAGLPEDPVSGGGVGHIEFDGRATSPQEADALATRLEAIPGIANVTISTTAYSTDGPNTFVTMNGTAVVTDLRLTSRLLPQDGVTAIDPSSIPADGGALPAPSPSPAPSAAPTEGDEN